MMKGKTFTIKTFIKKQFLTYIDFDCELNNKNKDNWDGCVHKNVFESFILIGQNLFV